MITRVRQTLMVIFVACILCINHGALGESLCQIHSGKPTEYVPLYREASYEAPVICWLTNHQTVRIMERVNSDFVHVQVGAVGFYPEEYMPFDVSGFISGEMIYSHSDDEPYPIQYINPQINSPNMEQGAPIYNLDGHIMGYIQNSQRVNLLADYENGYCLVSCSSSYIKNISYGVVFGFVLKEELSPFDHSPGRYPFDTRLTLDVHTYAIHDNVPESMFDALTKAGWNSLCPTVGGICALDGNQAFLMWKDVVDGQVTLTYLRCIHDTWFVVSSEEFSLAGQLASKCQFKDRDSVTFYYEDQGGTVRISLKRSVCDNCRMEWTMSHLGINNNNISAIAYCDQTNFNSYLITIEWESQGLSNTATYELTVDISGSEENRSWLLDAIFSLVMATGKRD